MTRITTQFHLSDLPKEVLAKVKAAPNPHMAYEIISKTGDDIDNNFATARNTLERLGVISTQNGAIEIVDDQVMQDEGITDEMGELTPMGQQLAGIDRNEVPQQQPQQAAPQDDMGMDMGGDEEMDTEDELSLESLSFFKSINDSADLLEDVKKFTGK